VASPTPVFFHVRHGITALHRTTALLSGSLVEKANAIQGVFSGRLR